MKNTQIATARFNAGATRLAGAFSGAFSIGAVVLPTQP
jgi:hypothetical protein